MVDTFSPEQPKPHVNRLVIRTAALAVAFVVIALLIMCLLTLRRSPQSLTSKAGRIMLNHVTPGMKLQNNTPIAGTYRPSDGVMLYYMVTAKDHKAIGAGNIIPSKNNSFSRNLTLSTKGHSSETGQLEIYLQNTEGERLDSVALPVTIQ